MDKLAREKKYRVEFKNNKIVLLDKVEDENLDKK
ncbi:hypothetical protein ACVPOR_16105 [Staphylococcus aureus]